MAVSIKAVQDSRVALGPAAWRETFLIVPGSSDYVTNGYVISGTLTGFKLIRSAALVGMNAAATPYFADCVFVLAQLATSSLGFSGYSQFLFKVGTAKSAASETEVTGSGDLSGCIWQVAIEGY